MNDTDFSHTPAILCDHTVDSTILTRSNVLADLYLIPELKNDISMNLTGEDDMDRPESIEEAVRSKLELILLRQR